MSGSLLALTSEQYDELDHAAGHHPKPYMRERCSALRKVAQGWLLSEVARQGLLTLHSPDTIHDWVQRYKTEGIRGLLIRKGRGRKPSFSPCVSNGRTGKRAIDRTRAPGP